ncbi:MAG: tRNA-dihydrouridine synthase, partial [Euryarchaeota archaeon]|nr:tRNA-dihydrouridine synthase [Euryarchaeota archaeon]
ARAKARASGADGVMLGRAIFGNPWLFHPEKDAVNVSLEEKLRVMVEHTTLFAEMLPHKSLAIMKKHYKAYVQGFDGAHALRARLMEAENAREIETLVEAFIHDTPRALLEFLRRGRTCDGAGHDEDAREDDAEAYEDERVDLLRRPPLV